MDDELELIRPVLQTGEYVLWSGRPDTSVLFTGADGFLIPFGLYFLGFSTFWVVGVSAAKAPPYFPLFGSAFVLIGLYYVFGRFIVKWSLKRRTAYAITNRRAIVAVGQRSLREATLAGGSRATKLARNRQHLTVTFGADQQWGGLGIFRRSQVYPNTGMDFFDFAHRFPVAFYDVSDVDGLQAALSRISAPVTPGT